MLDPIVNFFVGIFQWIGRGIGLFIGVILWPFIWAGSWYTRRGWILKAAVGVALLVLAGLYANFFYATQWWTNFDPNYVDKYTFENRNVSAGERSRPAPALTPPRPAATRASPRWRPTSPT